MNTKLIIIIVVLVLCSSFGGGLATWFFTRSKYTIGDVKFYGSDSCGWCTKQKKYFDDKGITYQYINCQTSECPEFVKSFPTLVVDGKVTSGYQEL